MAILCFLLLCSLVSPKTNVKAKKELREQLCNDVACKCKKETRCAEVATTLKRTNRQRFTSNSTMKAELVADSVEANPFPYKAKTNEGAKCSYQEKHLQQCFKAFISCPPSNPSAKPAEPSPPSSPFFRNLIN